MIINLNEIHLTLTLTSMMVDMSECNKAYSKLYSRINQVRKGIFSNTTRQMIEDIVNDELWFEKLVWE